MHAPNIIRLKQQVIILKTNMQFSSNMLQKICTSIFTVLYTNPFIYTTFLPNPAPVATYKDNGGVNDIHILFDTPRSAWISAVEYHVGFWHVYEDN